MKDNFSIIITMLIFVILIVIFPLYNYFERQDDMSYNLALKATTNFVDEVLESGYLTQEMYNKYVSELSNTGNIYDIQLEAHKKVLTDDNSGGYDEQFRIDYNKDIFETDSAATDVMSANIVKDDAYYLDEGDQFYVKMNNSNTTMAGAIFNTIVPTASKERISVNYGGVVKNQAWAKVDAKYYDLASVVSNAPIVELVSVSGLSPASSDIPDSGLRLYPNNANYVENIIFKASGPNNNSWWNKVEKYTWTLDGIKIAETTASTNCEVATLISGDHILKVYGEDEIGNKTDEKVINISVTESISGGTGGSEFNGTSLDVEIPRFINAYPKKITLDVYLAGGHAYGSDDFRLYYNNTSDINIMNIGNVSGINGAYYYGPSSSNRVRITASHSTLSTTFSNLTSGSITFTSVYGKRIRIILQFDYSNADLSDNEILKMFHGLSMYYVNAHAPSCYLNAWDDSHVMRNGVYNYDIEYTTI